MFWLAGITLLAATINGALGYGFSSITVPLALLFLSNRVLNPALVIIEVPLNAYVLWVNRAELPGVWRRALALARTLFAWAAVYEGASVTRVAVMRSRKVGVGA